MSDFIAARDLLDPANSGTALFRSTVLNNLGLVASARGDPNLALSFYQESLRAADRIGGLHGRELALTLDNMAAEEIKLARRAGPYWITDRYVNGPTVEHIRRAQRYLEDARTTFRKYLPHSRDDLLINLGHAVDTHRVSQDIRGAIKLSVEACQLLTLAPVDLDTAFDTVAVHADLLAESGDIDHAAETLRPVVDSDHHYPTLTDSRVRGLATASRIFSAARDIDRLIYCGRRVAEIDSALTSTWLSGASEESARQQFSIVNRRTEQVLGSLLQANGDSLPSWAYEMALHHKGLLACRIERAWAHARGAEAPLPLLQSVTRLRAQVAAIDLGDHNEPTIGAARARHRELQQQRNAAEEALFSAVDAELGPLPLPSLKELQASIPPDSVFIDLVLVESPERGAHRYYVSVEIYPHELRCATLGRMQEIDDAINELVAQLAVPPRASNVGKRDELIARGIRKLSIWSGQSTLPRQVFIAPTGLWARVPFNLLNDSAGVPLIDNHVICTVPSGQWWLAHRTILGEIPSRTGPPCVVGDPDFDEGLAERLDNLDFWLRMRVDRLPHSADEARAVAACLGCDPVLGRQATRHAVLKVSRPRVLHLATHGVFIRAIGSLHEQREPRYSVTKLVGGVVVTRPVESPVDPPGVVELNERHRRRAQWLNLVGPSEQLSRSALLLAGFNAWIASVGDDVGLVSAAELALMDLRGTELVVLSACESGVGSVDFADNSLIGIRTACLIAGAYACISSLWEVIDSTTALLMRDLYTSLLAGTDKASALRDAQLRVRVDQPDPYYWATWTLEGDPNVIGGF